MGNKSRQRRPEKAKQPPKQLAAPLDLDFIEVEEGEEVKAREPVKELLFTWKGKQYFMTAPEPTITMDIMEVLAERSDLGAMAYMARLAIGPENWRVLKSIPNITNDELGQVFERALDFTMSQVSDLGN